MTRRFTEKELLIASGNAGKVREIAQLLEGRGIRVRSLQEFPPLPEPEETGQTFRENALLKARYYGNHAGIPSLADDSGLSVAALSGQPGVYSARWAGAAKDFTLAMQRVEQKLQEAGATPPFPAFFSCALALYWPEEGESICVEGQAHGTLTFPARGSHGFGYDPIFIPEGHTRTFAEMAAEEKKPLSHRTYAFEMLLNACFR